MSAEQERDALRHKLSEVTHEIDALRAKLTNVIPASLPPPHGSPLVHREANEAEERLLKSGRSDMRPQEWYFCGITCPGPDGLVGVKPVCCTDRCPSPAQPATSD